MCGFCCFSMRFVVFLDLFGTITMPTTLIYFAYLIYVAVTGIADVGYISLILIGAIYGLQSVIFILRREWQHVGWMIIYLLAYPLWSFVLPVYSFWHFDDFSWGNTRVVVGDGKRKLIVSDDKPFDPASIPQRRWMEYESELASAGVLNAPPPNMNPNAGSSKEDERLSMYSRQSGLAMNRIGSVYGYSGAASVAAASAAGANQYLIEYGVGAAPSDEQIVEAIRRTLAGSDLTTMTKKKIRVQLAQEFNVDLASRKDFISDAVDRMLSGAI
ncbi:hypothetical protein GQ54DRAFT_285936 [Martensiomyces pterosporus]|nr:hypothetical protein GQ54DRAFT_285936 [Martensiomyces pterosporus]